MASATAEYALRAVIYLCRQPSSERISAEEIADAIGAPRNYLSKTLNALAKAGLVNSAAGRYGGFSIARRAREITLDRVVRVFEDPAINARCMLGNRPCNASRPCAAHHKWISINQAHARALQTTTIADLIAG